jgi:MFS family permease
MPTLSDEQPLQQAATPSGTAVMQQPSGVSRTFSALHHRNFSLFWWGQLISLIGTWMQSIGQTWLVLELTHSALLLGVVGALQFLPILFFSIFGGVVADKFPKRTILVCTQTFAMFQATALWLLVFTHEVQLWHVMVLAIMLGMTNSIDMPTRQAFVVEMVGREDLTNAIALNSSIFNMARIVGPGFGGLIIAWLGVAPLFLINTISFIPVIIGLLLIDVTRLHTVVRRIEGTQKQGTIQSLREGFVYIRQTPSVFMIIVVVGIVSLFCINFNVTLPLVATNVLHAGAQGFGFISSAFGVGSLISALWLAWSNRRPRITPVLSWSIVFCVLLGVFAVVHLSALSLVLIAMVGFAQIAFSALANATLQIVTPNRLRGRVMSVYMLVFAGSTPIGNLITGALAHWYGISVALLVCAVLALIAAVAGWMLRAPAEKSVARSSIILSD